MRNAFFTLWTEPRAALPPQRVWRDWALVAVLVPAAILDAIFREDLASRALALVLGVALIFTLLWRRTHPFVVVAVGFGSLAAVHGAMLFGADSVELFTTVFVVLLPYSLFRWGSGREIAAGLSIMLITFALATFVREATGDAAIAFAFLLLVPAAFGVSVRYRASAQLRGIESAKLRERGQLARELHDTVAHHVSAIVIQAQAGRIASETQPDAAVDALEVIEQEASRTLAEMRTMIGALRDTEHADLAPQHGVDDIQRLAANIGTPPTVEVEISGDLDELTASVDAAIYRLAQESITNAVRHAHNATRINVSVDGDIDSVRLSVSDDGDTIVAGRNPAGYGLIGMTERANLLGGTLDAGPSPDAGWTVTAVLPKSGSSA